VATAQPDALLAAAAAAQVPARRIGETGGARLVIGPPRGDAWIDADLAELEGVWRGAIPRRMAGPEGRQRG
jgi:hypothetical protein